MDTHSPYGEEKMKKFSAAALSALLIIGMLPVLMAGITSLENTVDAKNTYAPSYANHVAISIDGTDEFELQGWPGSGTFENPYVISDLNITTYSSVFAIEIQNTNAYFVIRDCYLWQRYSTSAVYLENITHGLVEDCEIISVNSGLRVDSGNNTEVSRVYIESSGHAFMGSGSIGVSVHDCDFTSSANRAISVDNYNELTIQDCEVRGEQTTSSIRISASDYVDVIDVHSYSGMFHLYAISSDYFYTTGFECEGGDIGIYLLTANNSTVEDAIINDASDYGILVEGGADNNIHSSIIRDSPEVGISFDGTDYFRVASNTILGASINGILVDGGVEGVVNGNTISNTGDYAIWCDGVTNVTISENNVDNVDNGVGVTLSNGIDFDGNIISNSDTYGVYAFATSLVSIVNNHISGADTRGIHLSACASSSIVANQIDDTPEGINAYSSDIVVVDSNTIVADNQGIGLSTLDDAHVENNDIQAGLRGIYLYQSSFCNFIDNVLDGSGWQITSGDSDYYDHTFMGNTVNGEPFGYFEDQLGGTVNAGNFGQILLRECNGTNVNGPATFSYATMGIIVAYSVSISIDDITTSNTGYGIVIDHTPNATITNYVSTGSTNYGISASDSQYLIIDHATIQVRTFADCIHVTTCPDSTLTNLNLKHGYQGVYMSDSPRSLILDSEFRDFEYIALFVIGSGLCVIENNYLMNCSQGAIYGENIDWTVINNNEVHYAYRGVVVLYCDDINITQNYITHANWGIGIAQVDLSFILNNTVLWNYYGIYLESSSSNNVYYNIIGPNDINGYDDTGGLHYWDDGVSMGNYWSDYTGGAWYDIGPGGGRDRYPQPYQPDAPLIDSPLDVFYAEGTTGHSITWQAFDNDLKEWSVTKDSVLYESDIWLDSDVVINIDGLPYGVYEFAVTLEDIYGHTVSDVVVVTVYDGTNPIINKPKDKVAFVEGSDQSIKWIAYDLHPESFDIYEDGVLVDSGDWNGGAVYADLDGMSVGEYIYKVVVTDIDGLTASDTVRVTVLSDTTPPVLNSPADFNYTYGQVSNYIVWTGEDENPWWYSVEIDGESFESGFWGGWVLAINVDGLDSGTYEFELTISDMANHTAVDSVTVTVYPVGYVPPPAIPIPLEVILLILGGAGVIVVVIVVIYIIRKKRA